VPGHAAREGAVPGTRTTISAMTARCDSGKIGPDLRLRRSAMSPGRCSPPARTLVDLVFDSRLMRR